MKKIIFCDIDGTILSHNSNGVPESTVKALQALKDNDVIVFACTGRHPLEIEKLPLTGFEPDGWIVMNGAYSYDHQGVISSFPIHSEDVNILLDFLEEHPFPVQFLEKDKMYMNMYSDAVLEGLASIHTKPDPILDISRVHDHDIYMFIPWVKEEIWSQVSSRFSSVKTVRWNEYAVDCFSGECGKDAGIKAVLEAYGIDKNHAYAAGDGENDIAMFEACGTSIAMGNADSKVKQYADYVTDDIDQDGFYKAVVYHGLI